MIGRRSLLFAATSDLLSGGAQVRNDSLYSDLVNGSQPFGAHVQHDPTLLRRQPEALLLGIDLPPTLGLDV